MLTERLFNLESFQEQYKYILILSVSLTIDKLAWNEKREVIDSKINWNNVLSISSILCESSNNEHLEASLRISQTSLLVNCTDEQKAAAIYILQKLTNIPAYELAIRRELIDKNLIERLPLKLKFEINKTKIFNSVSINKNIVSLNRFQRDVYEKSILNDSISISAPTSAGKSFILYQLLLDKITRVKNIIYIVPTRALISQVENDLNNFTKKYRIKDITITSVPRIEESLHNIYVLTQERLHRLYIDNPDFICDFLLVDEAHKIDNDNRGILLERKLEEIISLNPNVEIYFSSPFTSNPELLLEIIKNKKKKEVINTEFVAVNQNLIYISQQKGNTLKWNIELVTKRSTYNIGHINLCKDKRPTNETKKVGYIAYELGADKGGNIIYANGAAQAEDYAKIISQIYKENKIQTPSDNVKELIKLVKNSIHKDYILGKLLYNKISIHYGNLPLLIRQEIEKLFTNNEVDFLICTSTLLEEMNLPAKSIFIRKPQRGRNKPLNENDFWNLAGRAGRWGKEFSGNIFCIEPQLWDIKPNPDKKKQLITKALDDLRKNEQSTFIEYIENGSPREIAEIKQNFEFAFNYYYSEFLNNKLDIGKDFEKRLNNIFLKLSSTIRIPKSIIERNPGISPIAQQELLEYFERYSKDIRNLIPVYPEDENSYEEYIRLIGRIGKTIAKFNHKLSAYRSVLILNWMDGQPLSKLIRDSIKYYRDKGDKKSIDSICREVMSEIENFARFRFVKESSCYIDILKYFLSQKEEYELLENIPDLNLWLEFGVSEETQISLLSLGLSRQSTILLSEVIPNSNFNKQQCLEWINENDLTDYNFSSIIMAEIDNIKNKNYTPN
ncbi:DEAD/DEAH box helicase [Apibacter muscae]|uniref:DEAD/DEAH box helicase n=1 Tax=Apibacter muscae TaxID=2509004 RepID=UPI0011ADDAD0|nr:DEAD/DEAH box helicase [Apibacter muscae]TWP24023.1 DEAD/DEAH box helicase [Apibacter muscae]